MRTRPLTALLTAALLALPLAALPASAAPAAGPASLPADTPDDPNLQQRVGADEASVEGPEVVTQGHVDIGPRFLDGAWTLQARDDRTLPAVWRYPDETVMHVLDESVLPAPDSPDFAFLGVEPGTPLYVVPQVQNQDVVWLGWNTQDPEVTQRIGRGATLRLDGVQGPGSFFLFLQEGVTGPPNVLWTSGADYPQDLWMEVNTHVHANWVFTEPGVYTLDVSVLADLADGTTVEDPAVLRFAVGTATDPQNAFAATGESTGETADEQPQEDASSANASATADQPADEETAAAAADDAASDEGSATSTVALWAGLAVLVLVLGVGLTVLRGRRARAIADREADAS